MNITKSEKRRAETHALSELLEGLGNKQTYLDLWEDYETGAGDEAKLLKNIDKLEMGLQALEYMRQSRGRELYRFVDNADRAMDVEVARAILTAALENFNQPDSDETKGS